MTGITQSVTIRHGQHLQVVSPLGETRTLKVMVGDAFLNGEGKQIWLIHETTGQYLRKLPNTLGELGRALFNSTQELFLCIEERRFYFA